MVKRLHDSLPLVGRCLFLKLIGQDDMAKSKNGSNGKRVSEDSEEPKSLQHVQAQIVAQYVKDLSFENPNVDRLLGGPGEGPNMQVGVNVNAFNIRDDLYESAIDFKAQATSDQGTIYDMEIIYAGLFRIKHMPEETLEPFLLINCPALIFPFLRRLVADLSREGGFPPLLLDPIDFGALYTQRLQNQESVVSNPGSETKSDV